MSEPLADPFATPPRRAGDAPPGDPASPWAFGGMAGLAAVLFLDLTSLTFLPGWAVLLLTVLWVGLLVQACRWFVRRPRGVAALAAVGVGAWVLAWLAALLR